LAATERDLSRIKLTVERQRAPLRGTAAIGLAVGAILDKHKMAKHYDLTLTDTRFAWRRKAESIAAEARLDGLYVIRTNVPKAELSAEEVMAYVAGHVAPYKKIRHVEVVAAIPRSASGKILRRVLVERERAAAAR
jgi:acyl-CoA synthetase (AMP-forming)/AMP-acid ligase II